MAGVHLLVRGVRAMRFELRRVGASVERQRGGGAGGGRVVQHVGPWH